MKLFPHLLLSLVFFTSCNGQSKKNIREGKLATANEQTKLPKAHNSFTAASVDCGFQDNEGNIWFGTNGEGLFRYNGKIFTHFNRKDGLDNDIVYSILEDNAGNIWVGTQTGLNCYNGKTFTNIPISLNDSRFFLPNNPNSNNPPLKNGVWTMMKDRKGILWFGTDAGVYCYNGKYFTRFLDNLGVVNKDSLQLKAIFSILEDRTGAIWFGACVAEGISRFDGKSLINIVPQKEVGRVNQILEDKNGNLWFTTTLSYVCRYDGKTFAKNVFKEKDGQIDLILEDKSGNIWFDTQEGLGHYDGKTLKILTKKDGLPDERIFPVLEDKLGNIWFSAEGMGLYRWDGKTYTAFSDKGSTR